LVSKDEFKSMRETRESMADKKTVDAILRIIAIENKSDNFPSTREISNIFHGKPKDSQTLKTPVQDSILQSVLNPLRKKKILSAKYGKRNQLFWELNEIDLKRLTKQG